MDGKMIKIMKKGDDGFKVISVRIKDSTLGQIDELSRQTNRSRNELINILLENAVSFVSVESSQTEKAQSQGE